MIIPNAVGRIDAITEAIRDGDRERAMYLAGCEHSRLIRKLAVIERELKQATKAADEVAAFHVALISDDEAWHLARRDCGWEGEE